MEEAQNKGRLADITKIKNYKVIQLVRKVGVRGTFIAESTKSPGNTFSINALDLPESTELDKNIFLHEIRLFASVKHPFILHYHESFVDKKNGLLWYAML